MLLVVKEGMVLAVVVVIGGEHFEYHSAGDFPQFLRRDVEPDCRAEQVPVIEITRGPVEESNGGDGMVRLYRAVSFKAFFGENWAD